MQPLPVWNHPWPFDLLKYWLRWELKFWISLITSWLASLGALASYGVIEATLGSWAMSTSGMASQLHRGLAAFLADWGHFGWPELHGLASEGGGCISGSWLRPLSSKTSLCRRSPPAPLAPHLHHSQIWWNDHHHHQVDSCHLAWSLSIFIIVIIIGCLIIR